MLPSSRRPSFHHHFVIGVGSSQPCHIQAELSWPLEELGLEPLGVVHPQAFVSSRSEMAAGCQIMARAVVNTGVRLGGHVLIRLGAIVEHDAVIRAHSLVGSSTVLGGGVGG